MLNYNENTNIVLLLLLFSKIKKFILIGFIQLLGIYTENAIFENVI